MVTLWHLRISTHLKIEIVFILLFLLLATVMERECICTNNCNDEYEILHWQFHLNANMKIFEINFFFQIFFAYLIT